MRDRAANGQRKVEPFIAATLRLEGWSLRQLAKKFDTSPQAVYQMLKRYRERQHEG